MDRRSFFKLAAGAALFIPAARLDFGVPRKALATPERSVIDTSGLYLYGPSTEHTFSLPEKFLPKLVWQNVDSGDWVHIPSETRVQRVGTAEQDGSSYHLEGWDFASSPGSNFPGVDFSGEAPVVAGIPFDDLRMLRPKIVPTSSFPLYIEGG